MVRHWNQQPADPMPPPLVYSDDTNFDSNMVIILSALLCALICALGLNSIIRCAIRITRRNALDGQDLSTSGSANIRLKKEAMNQIPVVVFKSGIDFRTTECPICLGEFGEGESVRILPTCNHGFHVMCIDKWFVSRSSCPICRQLLFDKTV